MYYARSIVAIMVWASFIGLLVLIRYIKGIKQIKDFKKQTINIDFLFSIMLNLIMSWGWIIEFGRPYSVIIICFIGLITLWAVYIKLPGLVDWTDRLFSLISALAVNAEGIYVYVRYLVTSHKIDDAKHIIYFTVSILVLSFYLLYVLL